MVIDSNCLWAQLTNGMSTSRGTGRHGKARKLRKPVTPGKSIPSKWEVFAEKPGTGFGYYTACDGDLNGDGFDDLVISTQEGGGKLLLYFGGTNGLPRTPSQIYGPIPLSTGFKSPFAIVGDLDGDGFDDLAACVEPSTQNGLPGKPQLILFGGSRTGLIQKAELSSLASFEGFRIEPSVVAAGDLNGDGLADMAVHAYGMTPGTTNERKGAVFILGGARQIAAIKVEAVLYAKRPSDYFGPMMSSAGDVNGDGFDDFLIGVNNHDGKYPMGGKANVYYGSKSGVSLTPNWTAEYDLPVHPDLDQAGVQEFGFSVACAGDVNGDGFDDIVIGAPFAERWDRDEGLVFVYEGSRIGLRSKPSLILESNHPHAVLGWSVGGAGDVNGDGFDDLIVSAPQASSGPVNEGAALVFHGSKSGIRPKLRWSRLSDASNAYLGRQVAGAGDLNGDGYADVLITLPEWKNGPLETGKVLVEYGTANGLQRSDGWVIEKPWLYAFEQLLGIYHSRYGSAVYWVPPMVIFISVVFSLALVQWRLQRRITSLLIQNRELTLHSERARIARDMHDHLGADVTRLIFRAEAAKRAGDFGSLVNGLEDVSKSAKRVVETLSGLVWATDPINDTKECFITYLAETVTQFAADCGLKCDLQFPMELTDGVCDADLRHNLLLITREFLQNTARHADAKSIVAKLDLSDTELCLTLKDDGRGFTAPEWMSKTTIDAANQRTISYGVGFGLRNILMRAGSIGARIEFESTPGHGTMLRITSDWSSCKTNEGTHRS